jgi:hypothetical protein
MAAVALALGLGGCEGDPGNRQDPAGNGAGAGGNEAVNTTDVSICFFAPDDYRNFKLQPSREPGRPLVVTGEARTPVDYKPQLTQPEVDGGVLRLWLSHAASKGSPGDWQDVTYEHSPAEGITKVIVWCDRDTPVAELDVPQAGTKEPGTKDAPAS